MSRIERTNEKYSRAQNKTEPDECPVCFGIGTIYPKRPDGRVAYTAVECPKCGIGGTDSSLTPEKKP